MQELRSELILSVTSKLSPESVINLSATCRRFRFFYSPLHQYLKLLRHSEISIQLIGLTGILENINQLRDHFPLCTNILHGYLSSLPKKGNVNNRIIIEMILLRTTGNVQHAYKILHLIHDNSLHPLIVSLITEKIKKLFGVNHSLEKVVLEIQKNSTIDTTYYVLYYQFGFPNWILLQYLPLFYADLDFQHRDIIICFARDTLPKIAFTEDFEHEVENLKFAAITSRYKDLNQHFFKSFIMPFTYGSTDNHDLLLSLSRHFRKRFDITDDISEMLSCYDLVVTFNKKDPPGPLWAKLYVKIRESFEKGLYNTCWIYYPNLKRYQRAVLEEMFFRTFSYFMENKPDSIWGLCESDWLRIMEKSTSLELKELARSQFELCQRDNIQSKKQNSGGSDQNQIKDLMLEVESTIDNIIHYDSIVGEEKKTSYDAGMGFYEEVKKIHQNYWFMKDRFFQDCYEVIYDRIQRYLDARTTKCHQSESSVGDHFLLSLLVELFPDKFHDIAINILECGSLDAINKVVSSLDTTYRKVPLKYIRIYASKLCEYLLRNTVPNREIDADYLEIVKFLLHVIEYLSAEQQASLFTINTRDKSLFGFIGGIKSVIHPAPFIAETLEDNIGKKEYKLV